MKGDDSVLRKKVLREINEDFHQADKLNEALEADILMCLIFSCRDQNDDVIRELASRAVLKIANTESGRVTIVSSRALAIIANLFDDPVTQIRNNAYQCCINLAQFTYGINAIIDSDILRILVDKLVAEKEEPILVLILVLVLVVVAAVVGDEGQLVVGLEGRHGAGADAEALHGLLTVLHELDDLLLSSVGNGQHAVCLSVAPGGAGCPYGASN